MDNQAQETSNLTPLQQSSVPSQSTSEIHPLKKTSWVKWLIICLFIGLVFLLFTSSTSKAADVKIVKGAVVFNLNQDLIPAKDSNQGSIQPCAFKNKAGDCVIWGIPQREPIQLEFSSEEASSLMNDYKPAYLPIQAVKVRFETGKAHAEFVSLIPIVPGFITLTAQQISQTNIKITDAHIGRLPMPDNLRDFLEEKINFALNIDWFSSHVDAITFLDDKVILDGRIATQIIKEIRKTSSPVPQPTQVQDETANWKTYTSSLGQYSIRYPNNWYQSEEKGNNASPILKISPSSNTDNISNYGQTIFVSVQDSPKNLTIEEFNVEGITVQLPGGKMGKPQYTYTPILVDGIEGKRSTDIPGQFENDTVFAKKGNRIYEINWVKGPGAQIMKETFDQILSTFKFTDEIGNITGICGNVTAIGGAQPINGEVNKRAMATELKILTKENTLVKTVTSDENGKYKVTLSPGGYKITGDAFQNVFYPAVVETGKCTQVDITISLP